MLISAGALIAWLGTGASARSGPVPAKHPLPTKMEQASTAELIRALNDSRYVVREQASRALVRRGTRPLAALMQAVRRGPPERTARALQVLETIYVDPAIDDATVETIERELDEVRLSGKATSAQLAAELLARHSDVREKRALAAIRRLGGLVDYSHVEYTRPGGNVDFGSRINFVLLGRKWRGGDEGLKYVRRIAELRYLYIARSAKFQPVSKKALQELQRRRPDLEVQHRGLACLGVSGLRRLNGVGGCYVQLVKPGSAAAQGHIRTGDIITHFGGKNVSNFETLVKLIAEHDPGEKVEVNVLRSGRRMKLEVVLQGWKK